MADDLAAAPRARWRGRWYACAGWLLATALLAAVALCALLLRLYGRLTWRNR